MYYCNLGYFIVKILSRLAPTMKISRTKYFQQQVGNHGFTAVPATWRWATRPNRLTFVFDTTSSHHLCESRSAGRKHRTYVPPLHSRRLCGQWKIRFSTRNICGKSLLAIISVQWPLCPSLLPPVYLPLALPGSLSQSIVFPVATSQMLWYTWKLHETMQQALSFCDNIFCGWPRPQKYAFQRESVSHKNFCTLQ